MDYSNSTEATENDDLMDTIEGVLAVNDARCLDDAEDRDALRDDLYQALSRTAGTPAFACAGDGYFPITSVHRDDLRELGYDASRVDDATMTRLAGKLADAYCENVFWIDLPIIADHLGIPRKSDNCTDIQ